MRDDVRAAVARAVVRATIRGEKATLSSISADIAPELGSVHDRKIDRALQYLRRSGLIRYAAGTWRMVSR